MTTPPEEPEVPASGPDPAAAAKAAYGDAVSTFKTGTLTQKLGYAAGGLGILTFIAVLLPWESVELYGSSDSVSGLGESQHGWIPLILALGIGAFGVYSTLKGILVREFHLAAVGGGALITLVAVIDWFGNRGDADDVQEATNFTPGIEGIPDIKLDLDVDVSSGFGLYLTLLLGLGFVAVGILGLLKKSD